MTERPSHQASNDRHVTSDAMPEVPELIQRITNRVAAQNSGDPSGHYEALDGMRNGLLALKAQVRSEATVGASGQAGGHSQAEDGAENELSRLERYAEAPGPTNDAPDHTAASQPAMLPGAPESHWNSDTAEQFTAHCESAGLTASLGNDGIPPDERSADSPVNYIYVEPKHDITGQQWLENRLDAISRRLDAVAAPGTTEAAEMPPLLGRFEALEARIDDALLHNSVVAHDHGGDAAGGSLRDIELCIAEIATQLELTQTELSRLQGIETQITDIAAALAAERNAPTGHGGTIDLNALADQVASRIAQAPGHPAGSAGHGPGFAEFGELSATIQDFIREQRSEGEHANAVLDTMQQTIIRVLDRMEALEAGGPHGGETVPHEPKAAAAEPKLRVPELPADEAADTEHRDDQPAEKAATPAMPPAAEPSSGTDTVETNASIDRLQRIVSELEDQEPVTTPAGEAQQEDADAATRHAPLSRSEFIRAAREAATKANPAPVQHDDDAPASNRTSFLTAARQVATKAHKRLLNDDTPGDEIDATNDGFSSEGTAVRVPARSAGSSSRTRLLVAAVAAIAVGLVATKFMTSVSNDAARKPIQPSSVEQSSQSRGKVVSTPAAQSASPTLTGRTQPSASRLAQYAAGSAGKGNAEPGSVSYGTAPVQTTALTPDATATAANGSSVSRKALPSAMIGPLSLRLAAADGNPSAEFQVAARFAEGVGVEQNFKEAAKWYKRSAGRGFALAQYRLGTLYERGLGVDKDLQRARVWYQRSATSDNIKAMHNLAVLAASSGFGKPDYTVAAQWFTKAAERGLTDSQFNLAILYQNGLGVPQDDAAAYKWFSLAAAGGDGEAIRRKKELAETVGKTAAAMADKAVRSWLRKPSSRLANEPHFAGQAWQRRES